MHTFTATLNIIGVNPYVKVPDAILQDLFSASVRTKGPIPIHGSIQGKPYTQTLVRYAGEWRLYVNTKMLHDSPKHVGEQLHLSVEYDPRSRELPIHPKLQAALRNDRAADKIFSGLSPSLRHEINRYISNLKTEPKIDENVQRAIRFLHGTERFIGRNNP